MVMSITHCSPLALVAEGGEKKRQFTSRRKLKSIYFSHPNTTAEFQSDLQKNPHLASEGF